MQTLQISKETAIAVYKTASEDGKKLLETLFGKENLIPEKITDRVKTYEDACEVLAVDPNAGYFGTPDEIAYFQMKRIVRALNEGWTPDWNNDNERKWSPWFYLNSPRFRFSASYYGVARAYTAGGSRLCFKTEELSTYAAKQFLEIYKTLFS
jgi:hypothetical protein